MESWYTTFCIGFSRTNLKQFFTELLHLYIAYNHLYYYFGLYVIILFKSIFCNVYTLEILNSHKFSPHYYIIGVFICPIQ